MTKRKILWMTDTIVLVAILLGLSVSAPPSNSTSIEDRFNTVPVSGTKESIIETPSSSDVELPNRKKEDSNSSSKDPIDFSSIDFGKDPSLVYLLISCVLAAMWLIYASFYNTKIVGIVVTKIARYFLDESTDFSVGSFRFSFLAGKIMFKDLKITTMNYSVRILDGYVIVKWWVFYDTERKRYTFDSVHGQPSLLKKITNSIHLVLNGTEIHFYNRSDVYDQLFEHMKTTGFQVATGKSGCTEPLSDPPANAKVGRRTSKLLELFSVVKVSVNNGKIAFGNKLLETTLVVSFGSGFGIYTTVLPRNPADDDTHVFCMDLGKIKAFLCFSPSYEGVHSRPPTHVGQGLTILKTEKAELFYYQGVPGPMPHSTDPTMATQGPVWGTSVKLTRPVTITYGPWVDSQRCSLYKFFYPVSFEPASVSTTVQPGDLRVHTEFLLDISFASTAEVDLLFSLENVSVLRLKWLSGSSIHFHTPWLVQEHGTKSTVRCAFRGLESSTSLTYRKLLECESVELLLSMEYGRMWNEPQRWSYEIDMHRASVHYIDEQMHFFKDLINCWSSEEPPDLAYFVPFDWRFRITLHHAELLLLINQGNWVDTVDEMGNDRLALCSHRVDVEFSIPFTSFMPSMTDLDYRITLNNVFLRSFIATSSTIRSSILDTSRARHDWIQKQKTRTDLPDAPDSNCPQSSDGNYRYARRNTEWLDFMSAPLCVISVKYVYSQHFKLHPELQNIDRLLEARLGQQKDPVNRLTFTISTERTAALGFGVVFRQLWTGFKGNYLGRYGVVVDYRMLGDTSGDRAGFHDCTGHPIMEDSPGVNRGPFLDVVVAIEFVDLKIELVQPGYEWTGSAPVVLIDKLTMHYLLMETESQLQVTLSNTNLVMSPMGKSISPSCSTSSKHGLLKLDHLQFSANGLLTMEMPTRPSQPNEYAWLMDISIGHFEGSLTPLQIYALNVWVESFMFSFTDYENRLQLPAVKEICYHGNNQARCSLYPILGACPTVEQIQYRMFRLSVDRVDLCMTQADTMLYCHVSPVRFAECKGFPKIDSCGGSLFVNTVQVVHLLLDPDGSQADPSVSEWLEIGSISLGPVTMDREYIDPDRSMFNVHPDVYQGYDRKNRYLWFLWTGETQPRCGCRGGCKFFATSHTGEDFFSASPRHPSWKQRDALCEMYTSRLLTKVPQRSKLAKGFSLVGSTCSLDSKSCHLDAPDGRAQSLSSLTEPHGWKSRRTLSFTSCSTFKSCYSSKEELQRGMVFDSIASFATAEAGEQDSPRDSRAASDCPTSVGDNGASSTSLSLSACSAYAPYCRRWKTDTFLGGPSSHLSTHLDLYGNSMGTFIFSSDTLLENFYIPFVSAKSQPCFIFKSPAVAQRHRSGTLSRSENATRKPCWESFVVEEPCKAFLTPLVFSSLERFIHDVNQNLTDLSPMMVLDNLQRRTTEQLCLDFSASTTKTSMCTQSVAKDALSEPEHVTTVQVSSVQLLLIQGTSIPLSCPGDRTERDMGRRADSRLSLVAILVRQPTLSAVSQSLPHHIAAAKLRLQQQKPFNTTTVTHLGFPCEISSGLYRASVPFINVSAVTLGRPWTLCTSVTSEFSVLQHAYSETNPIMTEAAKVHPSLEIAVGPVIVTLADKMQTRPCTDFAVRADTVDAPPGHIHNLASPSANLGEYTFSETTRLLSNSQEVAIHHQRVPSTTVRSDSVLVRGQDMICEVTSLRVIFPERCTSAVTNSLISWLPSAVLSWHGAVDTASRAVMSTLQEVDSMKMKVLAVLLTLNLPSGGQLFEQRKLNDLLSNSALHIQKDFCGRLFYILRRGWANLQIQEAVLGLRRESVQIPVSVLMEGINALLNQWKCLLVSEQSSDFGVTIHSAMKRSRSVHRRNISDSSNRGLVTDAPLGTLPIRKTPSREPRDKALVDIEEEELHCASDIPMKELNPSTPSDVGPCDSGTYNPKTISVLTQGVPVTTAKSVFAPLFRALHTNTDFDDMISQHVLSCRWSFPRVRVDLNTAAASDVGPVLQSVVDLQGVSVVLRRKGCSCHWDMLLRTLIKDTPTVLTNAGILVCNSRIVCNIDALRCLLHLLGTFDIVCHEVSMLHRTTTHLSAASPKDTTCLALHWKNMLNVVCLYISRPVEQPGEDQLPSLDALDKGSVGAITIVELYLRRLAQKVKTSLSLSLDLRALGVLSKLGFLVVALEVSPISGSLFSVNGHPVDGLDIFEDGHRLVQIGLHLSHFLLSVKDHVKNSLLVSLVVDQGMVMLRGTCTDVLDDIRIQVSSIAIHVPQHPGILHKVVLYTQRKLKTHVKEIKDFLAATQTVLDRPPPAPGMSPRTASVSSGPDMSLGFLLGDICISGDMLPSLSCNYKAVKISAFGMVGLSNRYSVRLSEHSLSFVSKVPRPDITTGSTVIPLPMIQFCGKQHTVQSQHDSVLAQIRKVTSTRKVLQATLTIGNIDQTLSTGVVNNLIYLQKGFGHEVSQLLVDAESFPVIPWWELDPGPEAADNKNSTAHKGPLLLFKVTVLFKGLRLTALTPSTMAVLLDICQTSLEASNARQYLQDDPLSTGTTIGGPAFPKRTPNTVGAMEESGSLVVRARAAVSLSLCQVSQSLHPNGGDNFYSLAFLRTTISFSNSKQDMPVLVSTQNTETFLVTVHKPQVFMQPGAVDKALLVYFHYMKAYEFWCQQCMQINRDLREATEKLLARVPPLQQRPVQTTVAPRCPTFLQLDVHNLSVSMPIVDLSHRSKLVVGVQASHPEWNEFVLVTMSKSLISFCHSDGMAIKGLFRNLRFQFVGPLNISSSDWTTSEEPSNYVCVPEGFYELCSKVESSGVAGASLSRWVLGLRWNMCGLDAYVSTTIGHSIRNLSNTVTSLTGDLVMSNLFSSETGVDSTPDWLSAYYDQTLAQEGRPVSPKDKLAWLEDLMFQQANKINSMRLSNTPQGEISKEMNLLRDIEAVTCNEFLRGIYSKFKTVHKSNSSAAPTSAPDSRVGSVDGIVTLFRVPSAPGEASCPVTSPSGQRSKHYLSKPKHAVLETSPQKWGPSIDSAPDNSSDSNFEFVLDVCIRIDSGKITLLDLEITERSDKHDSWTNVIGGRNIPTHSSSYLAPDSQPSSSSMLMIARTLLLPAISVQLHYQSLSFVQENELSPQNVSADDQQQQPYCHGKRANLKAQVFVDSLSKEVILRPSFLDFVQAALEPLVVPVPEQSSSIASLDSHGDLLVEPSLQSSASGPVAADVASFPIDAVIIVQVKPSDIRLSCAPVSKVECLLRLPGVDMFISNRSAMSSRGSHYTCCLKDASPLEERSYLGSLSCTLYLSCFNLCIYHPYGRQLDNGGDNIPRNMDTSTGKERHPGSKLAQLPKLSGRRDAFSLGLEFVKFSLHRCRYKVSHPDKTAAWVSTPQQHQNTEVKVSFIADTGEATFNYDMRRLNEILDVPKAWHRPNLLQWLFLGKEGAFATNRPPSHSFSKDMPGMHQAPQVVSKDHLDPPKGHAKTPSGSYRFELWSLASPLAFSETTTSAPSGHTATDASLDVWSTQISYLVDINKLNIVVNMANVMGQTSCCTDEIVSMGTLVLNSGGMCKATSNTSVLQSSAEARGGVLGGFIAVESFSVKACLKESLQSLPQHSMAASVGLIESKLEYMGSPDIMFLVLGTSLHLEDHWTLNRSRPEPGRNQIDLNGRISWQDLHLVMCRSTTSDLVKAAVKIKSFIEQQRQHSASAWSAISRSPSENKTNPTSSSSSFGIKGQDWDAWSNIFNSLSELSLNFPLKALDATRTTFTGGLVLGGQSACLAFFHGPNFRTPQWAVFSVIKPQVEFVTTACLNSYSSRREEVDIVQKITLGVGTFSKEHPRSVRSRIPIEGNMAVIRRVMKGNRNPPTLSSTVQEWLLFVNSIGNEDSISGYLLYSLERHGISNQKRVSFATISKYDNLSEIIFSLPKMAITVMNEHRQPVSGGTHWLLRRNPVQVPHPEAADKPLTLLEYHIDCSLEAWFQDSIGVTTDVSLIMFLHELVQKYLREYQTCSQSLTSGLSDDSLDVRSRDAAAAASSLPSPTANSVDANLRLKRTYRSKSWRLEPSIRFLTWAGKHFDPVNVDWVLDKLGFKAARLTIPKWTQRGALDPLDFLITEMVARILSLMVVGTADSGDRGPSS